MGRREKLLSGLDLSTSVGVEIGPLCSPAVTKSEGNIVYVDHADTDTLRKKYADDPAVNVEGIVEVDAVWGKQTLEACLKGEKADYVIASHVVEHVPDMITWLEEIEAILRPGGSLRLVVPDRRFTFDFLRRESRLCDIVNAYVLKARTPLPIAILDFFISMRQVDLQAAWEGKLPPDLPRVPGHDLNGGMGVSRDQIANGNYHDVHCWVFTPRSFTDLFAEASAGGLIHFACDAIYDTEPGQLEFVAVLRLSTDREQAVDSWRRAASSVAEFKVAPQSTATIAPANGSVTSNEKADLRQKEEELQTVKQTLASVLSSRSWKLTEPLRALKRAFRS
jgi:hypothetical protein